MAELIFLGTAGDATTMGKQILASGGIYLVDEQISIHLDPGPGSLVKAKEFGASLRDTDVILVSQQSILHSGDVPAALEAMTIGGLDRKGVLVGPHAFVQKSESLPQISYVERVIPLREGDKVGISDIQVIPTKCSRREEDLLGYVLSAPDYSIGYIPDKSVSKAAAQQYKGCDILIIDASLALEEVKYLAALKPKLFIVSFFNITQFREDPLVIARNIQKETKVQTFVATDGLKISPKSHATKSRQRKLKQ